MKCDFSYQHYYEIIENFKKRGYSFGTFDKEFKGKTVWLRHDLDHSIEKVVPIADIERTVGAKAAYSKYGTDWGQLFVKAKNV